MKAVAILFLSCLSLCAQSPLLTGSGIDWTIALSSQDIPSTISGMYIRLKATDTPASSLVSNWVDEIHNFTWTNSTGSANPSNSTSLIGMKFASPNWLKCTNSAPPQIFPTQEVFIVFRATTLGPGFNSVFGQSGASAMVGPLTGPSGFGVDSGGEYFYDKSAGLDTAHYHDYLGNGAAAGYTNGLAAGPSGSAGGVRADFIGVDQTVGDPYIGFLMEMIVWTNQTIFTATTISNLHYYATNTYQFAP